MDVRAFLGQASDPEILEKAGIQEADMLIAVTQSDEVNMVTCEVVNALFNVKTKIARIRNQSYLNPKWQGLFGPEHLIISPEIELAHAIYLTLSIQGAFSVIPLVDGLVKVIAVRCHQDTPLINTPIRHLNNLFPTLDIAIIGIVRDDDNYIPLANDILKPNDEVYFVVNATKIEDAMQAFGYVHHETHHHIILGGGNVGLKLAQEIEENMPNVQSYIIEKDHKRAEEIAHLLHNTIVLCGDCLDAELLHEAGVKYTQTVMAVTAAPPL